jgi:serine protease Do
VIGEDSTVSGKIRIVLLIGLLLPLAYPLDLPGQRSSPAPALKDLRGLSDDFEALSARVGSAVVQVVATGYQPPQQGDAPGSGLLSRRQIGGSGVILDPDGYIVTNLHVVGGAGRIQVRLPIAAAGAPPGTSILRPLGKIVGAQIVGVDRETDLAVLKVDGTDLPYLDLGDSDEVRTGQLVFAFGSPLGLENSVTMGIVSAVARQLRLEDPMIYIQTDATINPGSSGGPLVDAEGRVIGINTLILSQSGGSEGIGFAAPSNIVRNVYEQIKATGYVRRGVIGVHAETITPTLAAGLGLARDWGVVIGDIYPGGPAQQLGLRIGDIVISLDGKVMENGRQLDVNVYRRPVGEVVSLKVLRGEQELTFQVPVYDRPDDINRFSVMVTPEENLVRQLGILAVDLTPQAAARLPFLRLASGVVVAARSPDATYGRVALQPGDVIHALNGRPVNNLAELREAIDKIEIGQAVVLQVERRGRLRFMAFEMR